MILVCSGLSQTKVPVGSVRLDREAAHHDLMQRSQPNTTQRRAGSA